MVQLGAILAAEPQRAEPGARIAMFVVGARGEAGVWLFRCIGAEAVETGIGRVEAIKFVREPRDPHDTTVQVWLDPQRPDCRFTRRKSRGPDDEGFECVWRKCWFRVDRGDAPGSTACVTALA
jgi:hypothetical protein